MTNQNPTLFQTDGPAAVWLTIAEVARRKGLHRASVRERVDRLVAKGILQVRIEGRSRLIDIAAFDHAIGQAGDAVREMAAEPRRLEAPDAVPPGLRDAQTERAQYQARLAALDYQERVGNLLPVKGEHGVEQAMVRAAEAIIREIERTPSWAAELMTLSREGQGAVTAFLRKKRDELRRAMAAKLVEIAAEGEAVEAAGGVEVDLADSQPGFMTEGHGK